MLLDGIFTLGERIILRNRRLVFLPAIIIFAGLVTVKFAVGPLDTALAASMDLATTQEDQPVRINVLANDAEAAVRHLKVESLTQPGNGIARLNGDGTVTYTPSVNFSGTDTFSYQVANRQGQQATVRVEVTVEGVNDRPRIVSRPTTEAIAGRPYTYDVDASDPDPDDRLTYNLKDGPEGMTIDPTTGLLRWTPAELALGARQVTVTVTDSSGTASDAQSFAIMVDQMGMTRKAMLTIEKALGHHDPIELLATGGAGLLAESDNDRWETVTGATATFEFSDVNISSGAKIVSVVLYIEHNEDSGFAAGKLIWKVGTGWPDKPVEWVSIKAPLRDTARWEAVDSWDVTSFVDTAAKVNAMQFRVENLSTTGNKRASMDQIYAIVEWEKD